MDLIIREFRDADAAAFTLAVNQSLDSLLPWMSWAHQNYSEADALLWFNLTHQQRQQGVADEQGLFTREGDFLGGIGLHYNRDPLVPPAIGYWIRSSEQRKGIASTAVRQLATEIFAQRNIDVLEILIAEENTASRAVALKVGAKEMDVRYGLIVLDDGPVNTVIYHLHRTANQRDMKKKR